MMNSPMNIHTPHSRLYVMVGLPGSGKSYFCHNNEFLKTINYVSRDEIRFEILDQHPEADYFDYESEVFNTFISRLSLLINWGEDAIADATHLNKSSRTKLIQAIQRRTNVPFEIIYIVFDTLLKVCLAQNAARSGRALVPQDVIIRMDSAFHAPTIAENTSIAAIFIKYTNDDEVVLFQNREEY